MRRCEGRLIRVDESLGLLWAWPEPGAMCLNRAELVLRLPRRRRGVRGAPDRIAVCLEHAGATSWMRDAEVIEFLGLRA